MKRLFIAILTLAMLLSLCACGKDAATTQSPEPEKVEEPATTEPVEAPADESPTLDELLATAVELDGYTFYQEYDSNKVKVSSEYEGTACLVEGTIDAIENDHIVVVDSNLKVNVYLSTEEIIELEKGQSVTVVGILENMEFGQNMSLVWVAVDFNIGYLAEATYIKTGTYYTSMTTDGTHPQGAYLECKNDKGNTYYVRVVLNDEQKAALTPGTEVTLEGKMIVNDDTTPHSAYWKLVVTDIK